MAGAEAIEVSFMWPYAGGCDPAHRSYGKPPRQVQRFAAALTIACIVAFWLAGGVGAASRPIKIVALGDSLTAGYQLPAGAAFPAQLETALKAKGLTVEIVNAGVSGDTSSGGLARLDWSVPEGTDAVILELGANDMLRGVEPEITRATLASIIRRLQERRIEVLLCGMLAVPNLGPDFARAFNGIYPQLAAANGLVFHPFFLEGVAGKDMLNQADGLHPTAAGVAAIVARILPKVEALIARVRAKPAS